MAYRGLGSQDHHIDHTPAHEHCTRAKLVKVRGCYGCPFVGRPAHGIQIIRCSHPAAPTSNDVYSYYERLLAALRPPLCPLLKDDKPGPGVRIVAVDQEKE